MRTRLLRSTCSEPGCEAAPLAPKSRCRPHLNEHARAIYASRSEVERARARAKWQSRVERNGDVIRARVSAYQRRHKYGVDSEWFRNQLVGQACRCAICGYVMAPGRDTQIDHDHLTGKVRGLLCGHCNRILGLAGDSPRIRQAAVRYLQAS